jgi:hypothetical protein
MAVQTQNGLCMMGLTDSYNAFGWNTTDMYIIRAYYNGETPCNDDFIDPSQRSTTYTQSTPSYSTTSGFADNFPSSTSSSLGMKNICSATTIASGDNTFSLPTAVKQQQKKDEVITIYPNPSGGLLHLSAPAGERVEISDCFGRLLKSYPAGSSDIDLSAFRNGLYLVHIYSGGTHYTEKIQLIR